MAPVRAPRVTWLFPAGGVRAPHTFRRCCGAFHVGSATSMRLLDGFYDREKSDFFSILASFPSRLKLEKFWLRTFLAPHPPPPTRFGGAAPYLMSDGDICDPVGLILARYILHMFQTWPLIRALPVT